MKEKFNIIHDKDTELFFERIGLLKELKNKKIRCVFCDSTISIKNFRGAFKKGDRIYFLCDNAGCFSFHPEQVVDEAKNG